MKSVALLLDEVRLGRLELVDDLVALLGDRLAHLEHTLVAVTLPASLLYRPLPFAAGPFPRLRLPTTLAKTGLA